jgi:hypothetical protein
VLYVRQSSLKQVIHNTESAIRQYDLRGRAIALGWDASQITVIDIDQGQSGASAADREGCRCPGYEEFFITSIMPIRRLCRREHQACLRGPPFSTPSDRQPFG